MLSDARSLPYQKRCLHPNTNSLKHFSRSTRFTSTAQISNFCANKKRVTILAVLNYDSGLFVQNFARNFIGAIYLPDLDDFYGSSRTCSKMLNCFYLFVKIARFCENRCGFVSHSKYSGDLSSSMHSTPHAEVIHKYVRNLRDLSKIHESAGALLEVNVEVPAR